MTLTQELAQALREAVKIYSSAIDTGSPEPNWMQNARAALANYDQEPLTLRVDFNRLQDRWREMSWSGSSGKWAAGVCADELEKLVARYEPPTSRGSEGEVKPVAWQFFKEGGWHHTHEAMYEEFLHSGRLPVRCLYAAPPPAQPSAEAWKSAMAEFCQGVNVDGDAFFSERAVRYMQQWVESRAREISKGAPHA